MHSTIEIPTINLKELELHAEPGVVATLSSLINNNIEGMASNSIRNELQLFLLVSDLHAVSDFQL